MLYTMEKLCFLCELSLDLVLQTDNFKELIKLCE